METNNHQINDYSAILEHKYGKLVNAHNLMKKHTHFIPAKFFLMQGKRPK